jgi:tetratricopeptide (TPR) repeat protein
MIRSIMWPGFTAPTVFAALMLAAPAVQAQIQPRSSPASHCLQSINANPAAAIAEAEALYEAGNTIDSRQCLGVALVAQGEAPRGARILEDLAREIANKRDVSAGTKGLVWSDAGRAWLEADDIPKALTAFDNAVKLMPSDRELRVDRAVALGGARRFWDAIDDLTAAINGGVDTAEVYLLRATAWREVGTAELAMDDINRAAKIAPDDPNVVLERARLRALSNDASGAQQDFLTVMKLAPGTAAAVTAHNELEALTQRPRR